MGAL
ncbi:uncharacterized protein FTOL_13657 [Fusarium torulosum]|jgi:hypothetical protein